MRRDMSKKLVERPRWGHQMRNRDVRYQRSAMRLVHDEDSAIAMWQHTKMRPRRGSSKCLNENLAPLRRFLKSACGRPWDKVYSEIRQNLAPTSTMDMHIMQHLWQYVRREVILEEGRVWTKGWGGYHQTYRDGRSFYVHPRSGILLEPKHRCPRRDRGPVKSTETRRVIDRETYHLYYGDVWYRVAIGPIGSRLDDAHWDALLKDVACGRNSQLREALYGGTGLRAVEKKQLNKKELRQAKLGKKMKRTT